MSKELEQRVVNAVFAGLDLYFSQPEELSKSQFAEKLGISRPTLNKRIKKGEIQTLPNGRMSRLELLRLLSKNRGAIQNHLHNQISHSA